MKNNLYLGLDCSTQSMKAIVIDPVEGKTVAEASVNFGKDLPQYNCPEGYLANADRLVKHADPLLWLAALDLVLIRLRDGGCDMAAIAGIGGDGQQHGSVYLNAEWQKRVQSLDPRLGLPAQINPALARTTSPIWMDSSTFTQCADLNAAFGRQIQTETGSSAIERFAGPQIMLFSQTEPELYAATQRIHLVSSFLCSVLIGGDAPIDFGDGAGMNLLNLKRGEWDRGITAFIDQRAEEARERSRVQTPVRPLVEKLPLLRKNGVAGKLCRYFTKYGLRAGIPVAIWTGDNPASLVGTGAWASGVAVVSLGTSDTFFASMDAFRTDPDGCGHVFGNPAGGFMSLICFKNGSVSRDRVRTMLDASWQFFDEDAFALTPPGNEGRIALPWFEAEITPPRAETGLRANFDWAKVSPEVLVRAVVEGQALAIRHHSQWIGEFNTIRVTGGASKSVGIRQTLADVFQAKVERIALENSAALGSAMLAASSAAAESSLIGGATSLSAMTKVFTPVQDEVVARPETAACYEKLLPQLTQLEN